MSFDLDVDAKYSFEVIAPFEEVFALLSDIPRASQLHPTLDRIIDLGAGKYRWEMKKFGTERFNIQTIYSCNYIADREAGTITWKPISGEGNALVNGSFTLKRLSRGTQVDAYINSSATLPIPVIMKKLVYQFIVNESKKLNEKYISNLIQEFGGGRMLYI